MSLQTSIFSEGKKKASDWLVIDFLLYFVHRLVLHMACDVMLQQMTWGKGEQLDFSTLNYISVFINVQKE